MTWLDGAIVAIFILFVVIGARLGSLWTGACIIGGFVGAALVDIYALPLSGLIGSFSGSTALAGLLLFIGGLAVVLIPGAVLSKIGSVFILHLIDGAFGLLTGAFAAFLLISAALLTASPMVSGFRRSLAFRNSVIARPLYHMLEEASAHLPYRGARQKIEAEASEKISDLSKNVTDTIKSLKK